MPIGKAPKQTLSHLVYKDDNKHIQEFRKKVSSSKIPRIPEMVKYINLNLIPLTSQIRQLRKYDSIKTKNMTRNITFGLFPTDTNKKNSAEKMSGNSGIKNPFFVK